MRYTIVVKRRKGYNGFESVPRIEIKERETEGGREGGKKREREVCEFSTAKANSPAYLARSSHRR